MICPYDLLTCGILQETIYCIMQFPQEGLPEVVSVDVNSVPEFLYHGTKRLSLLEKLITVTEGSSTVDKMVCL